MLTRPLSCCKIEAPATDRTGPSCWPARTQARIRNQVTDRVGHGVRDVHAGIILDNLEENNFDFANGELVGTSILTGDRAISLTSIVIARTRFQAGQGIGFAKGGYFQIGDFLKGSGDSGVWSGQFARQSRLRLKPMRLVFKRFGPRTASMSTTETVRTCPARLRKSPRLAAETRTGRSMCSWRESRAGMSPLIPRQGLQQPRCVHRSRFRPTPVTGSSSTAARPNKISRAGTTRFRRSIHPTSASPCQSLSKVFSLLVWTHQPSFTTTSQTALNYSA